MYHRHLNRLFEPESIAVIGASNKPRTVGNVIMRNLLEGGFAGPIMPVNPRRRAVAGVLTYRDVDSLPETPDLAVLCTPPQAVAETVERLGAIGTRAAVIITGGMNRLRDGDGRRLREGMLRAAKRHGVRLLGSNSLGLLVPKAGLNASFAHVRALPGRIAFVSQSGALCSAVLDWAYAKGIGFSKFVSLGAANDVDFGDVLDLLAGDPETRAILLYIEEIRERRNFMAAARAAARNKPVLVIKAGRLPEEAEHIDASATHSGVLARPDEVFDAAIRRAGMLRVDHIDELFAAVETLGRGRNIKGDRIAVLTNGGGTGIMATDELVVGRVPLTPLSEATLAALDESLPANWSRTNPVDVGVDADGARYAAALKTLIQDDGFDAVLAMHAPTALASPDETAEAVVRCAREVGSAKLLTCWTGGHSVGRARALFAEAHIPTYDTPSAAVRAFLHLVNYHRNQKMLMQTPPEAPEDFRPAVGTARLVIDGALARGQRVMTQPQSKAVLAAYGIPVAEARLADDVETLTRLVDEVGTPVAVTLNSPDLPRKWDVGGVALNLESAEAVRTAAEGMLRRVAERRPGARVEGFTIQRMVPRVNARQLIIGVTTDPLFGPVILFGEGGRAVEVIRDHAIGLPPLNLPLARELVSRTRIWKLLQAYHDRPAADIDAVCLALMKVSQLIVDMPEIVELDINPLFADDNGIIAVDAHMELAPEAAARPDRLAIRPYPLALEEPATLRDGREVLLRPIRPEDEPAHHDLFRRLSPEDVRMRFFNYVRELRHSQMARFTQIDYDREMAFIATAQGPDGQPETLGVVRTVTDPDNMCGEFAIMVRSDLKGQGLGAMLMEKMIRYCRDRGTREMRGEVLSENRGMLALARKMGFTLRPGGDDDSVEVTLPLQG